MSEAKHTPGPWSWKHLPSERGPQWMVLQVGGLTVEAPSELVYIACHQADQRLIVAAPELLEALEGLMALESRGRIMPIGREWDAARAAIAKASSPTP